MLLNIAYSIFSKEHAYSKTHMLFLRRICLFLKRTCFSTDQCQIHKTSLYIKLLDWFVEIIEADLLK